MVKVDKIVHRSEQRQIAFDGSAQRQWPQCNGRGSVITGADDDRSLGHIA